MKVSARNLLPGKIKETTMGTVNAEIVVDVAPGIKVVSAITVHRVKAMELKVGSVVKAMVKASNVMPLTDSFCLFRPARQRACGSRRRPFALQA